MAGTADVLVWGDDVRVVADFLNRSSDYVDKFRLRLTRDISPKIKAVIFLYKNVKTEYYNIRLNSKIIYLKK